VSKPKPDDIVATIGIALYANGAMSITGNVGDVHLATGMLDSAREAIRHRLGKPSILEPHGVGIVVPNLDVVAPHNPVYPLVAAGDRKP
jgi:hypothetical protein